MALLGKISAVLTANTTDFTRGVRRCADEIQTLERFAQRTQFRLNDQSMTGTLTRLQQFTRQVQEIRNQIQSMPELRLRLPNPDRLVAQFRAFQDVGRPLTDLKNKIEGLSNTLQSGLYPELERIQSGFQKVFRDISRGGATPTRAFDEIAGQLRRMAGTRFDGAIASAEQVVRRWEQGTATFGEATNAVRELARAGNIRFSSNIEQEAAKVDRLTASIKRLDAVASAAKEIGELVRGLDSAGTGASFYQPRLKQTLAETGRLRNQAAAVPARFASPEFAELSARAEAQAEALERQFANVARLDTRIATRRANGVESASAQADLARLLLARANEDRRLGEMTSAMDVINSQIKSRVTAASVDETVRTGRQFKPEAAKAEFDKLTATLRGIDNFRFSGLISAVGDVVKRFANGTASAKEMKKALESMQSAADIQPMMDKMRATAQSVLYTPEERNRRQIRTAYDRQRSIGGTDPNLLNVREQADLARESFERTALDPFSKLEEAGIEDKGFKSNLSRVRGLLLKAESELESATNASTPSEANQHLVEHKRLLGELLTQYGILIPMSQKLSAQQAVSKSVESTVKAGEQSFEKQGAAAAAQFDRIAGTLRAIDSVGFEPAIAAVGQLVDQLAKGGATAEQVKKALEDLGQAAGVRGAIAKMEQNAGNLLAEDSTEARVAKTREAFARERDLLPASDVDRRQVLDFQETAAAERVRFDEELLPKYGKLQKTAAGFGDDDFKKEVEASRKQISLLDAELREAFSAKTPAEATAALDKYKLRLDSIRPALDELTERAEEFSKAGKQIELFRAASGTRADKLDPTLERVASDVGVVKQLGGQLGKDNIAGRAAVQSAVESSVGEIERLTREKAKVQAERISPADARDAAKVAEFDKARIQRLREINELIVEQSQLLKRTLAANSGGIFKEDQIQAIMDRQAKNTGSFSLTGMASAQLAIQQGLFAIDDLMSATGGLEYKLRAVGNNISQLGLLLGQSGLIKGLNATTGLFVGMAAVMASHVAIAFAKYAMGSEEAEQANKTFNESLERQKRILGELTQSHKSLYSAMLAGAFSSASSRPADTARAIAERSRQRQELGLERRAELDVDPKASRASAFGPLVDSLIGPFDFDRIFRPETRRPLRGVADAVAEQEAVRKKLESETNPGQRVLLQRKLEEARSRAVGARARLSATPTSDEAVDATIRGGQKRLNEAARRDLVFAFTDLGITGTQGVRDANRREAISAAERARGAGTTTEKIAALREAQRAQEPLQNERNLFFFRTAVSKAADEFVAAMEETARALESLVDRGLISAAESTEREMQRAAVAIASAQEEVASAIQRGVPSAGGFQRELDAMSAQLSAAQEELAAAISAEPGQNGLSADERGAAIRRAQERVGAVVARQDEITAKAIDVRLARGFGGQRTSDALAAQQGRPEFSNQQAGSIARLRGVMAVESSAIGRFQLAQGSATALRNQIALNEALLQRIKVEDVAERRRVTGEIERQRILLGLTEKEAAAAEAAANVASKMSEAAAAVEEFRNSLERGLAGLREGVDEGLSPAQSAVGEARKRFAEGIGGRGRIAGAERELINRQERADKLQNAISRARDEAMDDPRLAAIAREREQITSDIKNREAAAAQAKARGGNPQVDLAMEERVQNRLAELRAEEARILQNANRNLAEVVQDFLRLEAVFDREIAASNRRADQVQDIGRFQGEIENTVGAAERRAQEAKERFLAAPTDENRIRMERAERDAAAARDRGRGADDATRKARLELEEKNAADREKLDTLARRRAETQRDNPQADVTDIEAQIREVEGRMDARRQEIFGNLNDETRRREIQNQLADRGRRFGMTEAERSFEDFRNGEGAEIVARRNQLDEEIAAQRERVAEEIGSDFDLGAPFSEKAASDREIAKMIRERRAVGLSVDEEEDARSYLLAGTHTEKLDDARFEEDQLRKMIRERSAAGLSTVEETAALKDAKKKRQDIEAELEREKAPVREQQDKLAALEAERQQYIERATEAAMKQVAPALYGFQQERENAMLQGPSRAALQAVDITTQQGQSELTRLLRRDDASRDVNLAELQKQSELLQKVVDEIRGIAAPVVN